MERKMKLYETYDYRTKKKYWWTQRDKNNNCYEIRQLDISKKYRLLVNEIEMETIDTFNDAVKKVEVLWAS